MKNKCLGVTVLAAISGIANAADCEQFGGAYLGVNVGWGSYRNEFHDRDGLGQFIDSGFPSSVTASDSNVVGGVQGGYNFQRRCTLLGLEADWAWSGLKTSVVSLDGDQAFSPVTDSITVASKLQWFSTVRARAGIIVDDVLVYVTGGLAYANFKRDFTYFEDGPVTTAVFSSDKGKTGWTVGAGAEWKWTDRWTLKGDFLFMQFKQDTVNVAGDGIVGGAGVQYRLDSDDSAWVMRIGANYRF